jgi:uncharacterized protein DUF4058
MPGPFPAMDPYLEHPARWPGLHQSLITYTRETLNTLLPPRYAAEIGERLYITQPSRSIYPDVTVWQRRPPETGESGRGGTAVAVAAAADPPWILTLEPVEIREVFIEIFPIEDQSRLVTVIQVLSYANKTRGSEGRELYLRKQQELLQSTTSLIEIDLLRAGEHTVAPPREEVLLRCGRWDYLVSLHRGGTGRVFEGWSILLRNRLPRIAIPLADGDPDVVLDLQPVFDRCYDTGPYARRLDYRTDPEPPLAGEDAAWADALLRERGLRGES